MVSPISISARVYPVIKGNGDAVLRSLQGILSPTLRVSHVLLVLCACYHCFLGSCSTPSNQIRSSQRDANETASCDVDFVGLLNLWNFASCHIFYSVSHACTSDYRFGLEVTPLCSEKTAAANGTRINHPHSSLNISVMPHTIDLGLMALVGVS